MVAGIGCRAGVSGEQVEAACIDGLRWIINERDAICATETERVVGFNAITCGAAFHSGSLIIQGDPIFLILSEASGGPKRVQPRVDLRSA